MDTLTHHERLELVERDNSDITISRQAELLEISRASIYYQKVSISEADIRLMNIIDEIYTKCPFYGSRRIKKEVWRCHRIVISRSHTRRLMRIMGIQAICPKPNLSKPENQNQKYPYLLRNLTINRPNQVWGTDITYIKLAHGFCYLMAIVDWYSRYVVSWELSESLEIDFVLDCLRGSLKINTAEILNSDQGSHYTSSQYLDILKENEIRISMDGKGRCMDNIFTERLWRTVKYENVYLKSYQNIREARAGLQEYFEFYNQERFHSSLDDKTPIEVYTNNSNLKQYPIIIRPSRVLEVV